MLDLRTDTYKQLYTASATRGTMLDVPDLTVLAIDGEGDPATSATYQDAVASLIALAWGVRSIRKAQDPERVFKVMPLEGVWSLPDELVFAEDQAIRDRLRWTLQIVQPDDVDLAVVEYSRAATRKKKRGLHALTRVELREVPGGTAAQLLHRGPYQDEPASLDRLHGFIRREGGRPSSGHREIYLNDPRRTAPEKLKTILRVEYER